MQLFDRRLSFARDLVLHWSDIRGGVLVPAERDLDLRELQRVIPTLSIMDSAPDASIVVVMGQDRMEPDQWPAVRDANWFDLIPPDARDLAVRARKKLIETPCGVYYHYVASGAGDFFQEAETLVLPIRTENIKAPSTISVTHLVRRRGKLDLRLPAKLEKLKLEYVDIGAGIPDNRVNGA
ncbi:MAG TPA: hypothetical protein VGU20_12850 [Stellaceae bacterium]|nr:hypothetical protein [Stellaceae bacterium]